MTLQDKTDREPGMLRRRNGFMPILDLYVFREFMIYLSILLLVFIILFILGDVFNDLSDFLDNGATVKQIVSYLLLKLPGNVRFILPISVLLACMWTMALFGKHMEVTAMRSSGLSLFRCGGSIFVVGLVVTGINIWFNEDLVPYTEREAEIMKFFATKSGGILPDSQKMLTFRSFDKHRTWLFKSFNLNKDQQEVVLKRYRGDKTLDWEITAEIASFSPKTGWTFYKGALTPYSHDGLMPKNTEYFKKLTKDHQEVPETPENILNTVKSKDELPSWVILRMVRNTKNMAPRCRAILMSVFYYRLAFPWSCFLAVFLGIPLATKNERSGIMLSIVVAIAVIVVYIIVSQLLLILGKQGLLEPVVAGLFPTLAFLVYGWYTVIRNSN
ncbi:MAG: LptF/LptG family permease [Victivallaceae bacterium]|nr:LptF/LptG family permease [Victivallaceae bacterium]